MKRTMQIDQFLDRITKLDEQKADYVAPQSAIAMMPDGEQLGIAGLGAFPLTPIAHGQIAERTRIPKAYYDRCGEVQGLRAANVNGWLAKDPAQRRTIRTLAGKARAVLSDRYRPLDNILIVKAALPVLAANPSVEVTAAEIGEARLYLQVVFPEIQGEVAPGDIVQRGAIITNSEVGMGAVDVRKVVWRLVCKNGMVGESVLRRYHVGRRVGGAEEDYSIFSDETIVAELESFRLRLRDILAASISQEDFDKDLAVLAAAAGQKIDGASIAPTVENITKRYAFTEDEQKAITNRVFADMDLSRWGVSNAITAQVHETTDPDRQYELERVGWEVATMAPNAFRELVVA